MESYLSHEGINIPMVGAQGFDCDRIWVLQIAMSSTIRDLKRVWIVLNSLQFQKCWHFIKSYIHTYKRM